MRPAYWYYGLILISLVLLAVSISYKRDFKLLVLALVITGIIHPGEVFFLFVLPAYRYLPQILPNPGFDNVAGALVSDLFIIPAAAAAINAFSLSWGGRLGIAAVFTGIDWLFSELGIYEHYWWRPPYTGILLVLFFAMSGWIWQRLREDNNPLFLRLAVIFLSYSGIYTLIHFIVVGILELYRFHIGWLADPMQEHFIFASLYGYLILAASTLSLGLKLHLRYTVLVAVMIAALNWLLGYYKILVPLSGFSPVCFTLIPVTAVVILIYLFRTAKMQSCFT